MNRNLFVLLLSLGFFACKTTKEASTANSAIPADFALTLTRSGCFGTCPSYMLHVQADGKVFYEGYSHTPITGKHTKEISEDKIRTLIKGLNEVDFWNLEKAYDNPQISDLPSTTMEATMDGKTHKVLDRFETPDAVKNFSILIDEVVGMDGFKPFDPGN